MFPSLLFDEDRQGTESRWEVFQLAEDGVQAGLGTPRKAPGFYDPYHAVVDLGDLTRRAFCDRSPLSNHCQHGLVMTSGSVLPKHDSPPFNQANDSARGQKVEAGGQVGGFTMVLNMRPPFFRQIKELPLGNPICAQARAKGLHFDLQGLTLFFQGFSPLVQLKLGEAFRQDWLDVVHGVGFQEVENHWVREDELAINRLRLPGQALGDHIQVNERGRGDQDKSHIILSAPSSSAAELLNLRNR